MQKTIKLAQFAQASPDEKLESVRNLASSALNPDEDYLDQQRQEIDLQIKKFECRYEMSSVVMKQKLSSGKIKETAEVCSWLLLLKVKDSLGLRPLKSWS